ncbi:glycerol-1-phosphate dehydrogenase [NAD(P)+] [Ereboglobus sp. PH5-10]|uniref:sn-glycerol-1-phosphate dehydrogenase n=1 Tax=Ereboglobus sp. PH5-10 TaxID=2940629 RepID=UPI0024074200|nr:sn-glycerol-1-phosphate dehydrogenase [Ereboglobus sp. PH5-10]MDF9828310.1 glycerol-1-phosphate dehydrogenase [NAD(P)+] [Ereboglobus sp. PH5-10]
MSNTPSPIQPVDADTLFGITRLSPQEALAAASETKALVLEPGCLGKVAQVFKQQFPGRKAVVIADQNTMAVAGNAVRDALAADGVTVLESFIFTDPGLYAEYKYVEQLIASFKTHDAIPVAVGSGTINDLTKRASHETGRQYVCVGTAASMDGYTAFGASITYENAKQTLVCPAPQAVLADIDVIKKAPPEMTASGYADLLAKVPAGADWIFADSLGEEPIETKAWTIVQGGLRDALADPAAARAGDTAAINALTEGLILGGFAMQWAKSSRPASGAEHQFSHLWDMEHHTHNGAAPSHGFKVGIGTLAITSLYEQLLRMDASTLDIDAICAAWPDAKTVEANTAALFATADFKETAVRETMTKYVDAAALRKQLELLKAEWPAICAKLRRQLIPFADIKQRLQSVGAPFEPEQIGITRQRLRETFTKAYHIRRRFTVLDVAVRTGWLAPALDALFGPGGAWEIK